MLCQLTQSSMPQFGGSGLAMTRTGGEIFLTNCMFTKYVLIYLVPNECVHVVKDLSLRFHLIVSTKWFRL